MNSLPMLYKAGCWSFILVGIGHIVTSRLIPSTPERDKMVEEMKNFSISLSGSESNLYLFHEGFSLMMGVLLIGFGALNLSFLEASATPRKRVVLVAVIVSLISLVISINYFFIVPVLLLLIASFCFFAVLVIPKGAA